LSFQKGRLSTVYSIDFAEKQKKIAGFTGKKPAISIGRKEIRVLSWLVAISKERANISRK